MTDIDTILAAHRPGILTTCDCEPGMAKWVEHILATKLEESKFREHELLESTAMWGIQHISERNVWSAELARLQSELEAARAVVAAGRDTTNEVQAHLNRLGLALSGLRGVTGDLDAALAAYDRVMEEQR